VSAAGRSLWLITPSGQRAGGAYIDDTLRKRVEEQALLGRYSRAGDFPRQRVEVLRAEDPDWLSNELYYQRGWTDGLPVVAPTLERVDAILKGTVRSREESLGELEPLKGIATIEKVAANAVMAGCDARHLAFVLAAVEAIADPQFNLRGVQTTDENVAPLLIVSGPELARYDLNDSFGVLGPGWRGNAAIGRALRLVMNNIGGGWPGAVSLAGLAQPARYTLCVAENEAKNPWSSIRESLGYRAEQTILVVQRAESVVNVTGGTREIADVMSSAASAFSMAHGGHIAVALSPYTARELNLAGLDRHAVQRELFATGRLAKTQLDKFWIRRTIDRTQWPDWIEGAATEAMLPVVERPEDITLIVTGGDLAIAQHAYFPSWGFPACRIVKEVDVLPQLE
jgi:hypothetical protein